MSFLPIFFGLEQKTVLIIGGGKIALAKLETVFEYMDRVTVISDEFDRELLDFSNQRVDNGFRCVFTCLRKLMKCIGKLKNPTTGAARYRSNRAMGEPPMMTVTSIGSALRNAIFQVRGGDNQFNIPVPCTPEDVARLCGNC